MTIEQSANRPTFTCPICGNVFRFYGVGEPAPDQTCLGCNPFFGNPANLTHEQNEKRAQLRASKWLTTPLEKIERDTLNALRKAMTE